jgi:hypothetical protein
VSQNPFFASIFFVLVEQICNCRPVVLPSHQARGHVLPLNRVNETAWLGNIAVMTTIEPENRIHCLGSDKSKAHNLWVSLKQTFKKIMMMVWNPQRHEVSEECSRSDADPMGLPKVWEWDGNKDKSLWCRAEVWSSAIPDLKRTWSYRSTHSAPYCIVLYSLLLANSQVSAPLSLQAAMVLL